MTRTSRAKSVYFQAEPTVACISNKHLRWRRRSYSPSWRVANLHYESLQARQDRLTRTSWLGLFVITFTAIFLVRRRASGQRELTIHSDFGFGEVDNEIRGLEAGAGGSRSRRGLMTLGCSERSAVCTEILRFRDLSDYKCS